MFAKRFSTALLFLTAASSAWCAPYFYADFGAQTYTLRSTMTFTRNAPTENFNPSEPVGSDNRQLTYQDTNFDVYTGYTAVMGLGYKMGMGSTSLTFEGGVSNQITEFDEYETAQKVTDSSDNLTYPIYNSQPSLQAPAWGSILLGYNFSARYTLSFGYSVEYTRLTLPYTFASHDFLLDGYADTAQNYLITRTFTKDTSYSKFVAISEYELSPQTSVRLDVSWIPTQKTSFSSPFTGTETQAPNNLTGDLTLDASLRKASTTLGFLYKFK